MKVQTVKVIAIILLSIVNLCASVPSIRNNINDDHDHHLNKYVDVKPNFLLIDYLNDGEIERRISFNGITAKETSIANSG